MFEFFVVILSLLLHVWHAAKASNLRLLSAFPTMLTYINHNSVSKMLIRLMCIDTANFVCHTKSKNI